VRSLIGAAFKRRVVADDWLGLEFVEGPGGQAIVERVYPKGPAAPTDLRPKDLVVSANGKRVSTLSDLRLVLVSVPARSTVKLGVVRGAEGEAGDGEPLAVTIPLEPVPTDELSDRFFGFKAEDTGEKTGVIVTSIRPGSPAEKLLMRKDDVIFGLGHWKIRNTEDLLMFLQFVAPGDLVDVKIRRIDGRRRIPLDGKIRAE
jgi:S1-C subfamily serine protease